MKLKMVKKMSDSNSPCGRESLDVSGGCKLVITAYVARMDLIIVYPKFNFQSDIREKINRL